MITIDKDRDCLEKQRFERPHRTQSRTAGMAEGASIMEKCTNCGKELHHDGGRGLCPRCWGGGNGGDLA